LERGEKSLSKFHSVNIGSVESCGEVGGWRQGVLGGKGRKERKEGVSITYTSSGDEKEKRVESSVSMPDPAPNLLGEALPPFLFLCLLHLTYPSLDRRVLRSTVKALDHKALGDRHDPALLHHQGLGVGLENAFGADTGLKGGRIDQEREEEGRH